MCIHCKSHICKSLWIKASTKCKCKCYECALFGRKSRCDCYTVDPPPCPFHLGDPKVNCRPRPLIFPLLPSHAGSVHGTFLASRGACSCRGRQFANSTHSDVIDNRKLLRGPDDFFLSAPAAPHVLYKISAPCGCP